MIQGKIQYRRKKLTLEQKALISAIREAAKTSAKEVKDAVPRLTGALKFSIGYKVQSKNKNRAYAIVGTKSKYSRNVKGVEKIPNKYALKIERIHHTLERTIDARVVARIRAAVAKEIGV